MYRPFFRIFPTLFFSVFLAFQGASAAYCADRDKLEAFLLVTGFDVALDSIALSAGQAPQMLGLGEQDFGADWSRVAAQVFDSKTMRKTAMDILEATLEDDVLEHAAAFYASDLGRRLVAAENDAHMETDRSGKREQGKALVAAYVASGSPRIELFNRMSKAIDGTGTSMRAVQEVQIRFLIAAAAAGVIKLRMEEADLRERMKEGADELRQAMRESSLGGAAYAYRDFSDKDVEAYTVALEEGPMRIIYELMNAVQYEIMAGRFEVLAARMADMHPGQDI